MFYLLTQDRRMRLFDDIPSFMQTLVESMQTCCHFSDQNRKDLTSWQESGGSIMIWDLADWSFLHADLETEH